MADGVRGAKSNISDHLSESIRNGVVSEARGISVTTPETARGVNPLGNPGNAGKTAEYLFTSAHYQPHGAAGQDRYRRDR